MNKYEEANNKAAFLFLFSVNADIHSKHCCICFACFGHRFPALQQLVYNNFLRPSVFPSYKFDSAIVAISHMLLEGGSQLFKAF
jgi:hypothetical protein